MKDRKTTGHSSSAPKKSNRIAVSVWLDKDVFEAIKASGPDWEDCVNDEISVQPMTHA